MDDIQVGSSSMLSLHQSGWLVMIEISGGWYTLPDLEEALDQSLPFNTMYQ